MLDVRRFYLGGSLPALLLIACSASELVEPVDNLASTAAAGVKVTAPSNTKVIAVSHSQIDVSWQDNSSNENGFEVHRSTNSPNGPFAEQAATGAGVVSYSDGGAAPSTAYCYEVRAFRTTGNKKSYSAFSTAVCATTMAAPPPPPPPLGLNAASVAVKPTSSTSVEITWKDNSTTEEGSRLERSPTSTGPWGAFVFYGPTPETFSSYPEGARMTEEQVCYRVIAFNAQGSSPPSNIACTTPPASPSSLNGTGVERPAIDLTWTDNSAAEDGYEVMRATPQEPWGTVADLPVNSTAYHDAAVTGNTTYYYMVRAKKDGGYSFFSNVISVAAASETPAAPSATDAKPTSSTAVSVDWTDASSNEDGFRAERSVDGGANWLPIGATGAWGGPIMDAGLVTEQQVCYRVFAFNSRGESPASETDCTTPPARVSDLRVIPVDDQTVDLTWTDNSAVEDGYEVWVAGGGSESGPWPMASLPANSTSYRFTGSYVEYLIFFVVATKDGGHSDF